MLAVWCFMVCAAVGERLAVSGEEPGPEEDRDVGDWFSLGRRRDSGDSSSEVTYPKRLVQHAETEEEMEHRRLDTRIGNSSIDTSPVHLAQSSFQLAAFGQTFTLDLELNHHLLSSEYVERDFEQDGRPSQSAKAGCTQEEEEH